MLNKQDLDEAYQGKKVLITGGLGFIGSNLAHRLVASGASVTIADCSLPDHGANLHNINGIEDRIQVSPTDIRDREGVDSLIRGQDYIFNLAAQGLHIDSMRDPGTDLDINCKGQLNILESCRMHNPETKIVFASTRQVYGKPEYLPLDERHPLQPVDINGIHKLAAEHYHILYHDIYGLRTTSIRLTNTYGQHQIMKHNRANFTGWLIRQAIDKEEISIFGDGSQLRDFTFINDAVEAFLLCGISDMTDGEIFNLGGETPYTILQFVELLLRLCPGGSYKCVPFPEERRRIDIGGVYSSYDKIKDSLGWSPGIHLEEGLVRTIDYFKQNKNHYW